MKRIVAGFVLAPLIFVPLWREFSLVPLAVAYATSLLVAAPLFTVFARLSWLKWWHVAFAGFLAASAFALLYSLVTGFHAEIYGPQNAVLFVGYGITIAVAFWWLALFKNARFPSAGASFPISMLALIPVAFLGRQYHEYLKTELTTGTVAEVGTALAEQISVRLASGEVVDARVTAETVGALSKDRGVILTMRKSMLLVGKGYWVIGCADNPLCT